MCACRLRIRKSHRHGCKTVLIALADVAINKCNHDAAHLPDCRQTAEEGAVAADYCAMRGTA